MIGKKLLPWLGAAALLVALAGCDDGEDTANGGGGSGGTGGHQHGGSGR